MLPGSEREVAGEQELSLEQLLLELGASLGHVAIQNGGRLVKQLLLQLVSLAPFPFLKTIQAQLGRSVTADDLANALADLLGSSAGQKVVDLTKQLMSQVSKAVTIAAIRKFITDTFQAVLKAIKAAFKDPWAAFLAMLIGTLVIAASMVVTPLTPLGGTILASVGVGMLVLGAVGLVYQLLRLAVMFLMNAFWWLVSVAGNILTAAYGLLSSAFDTLSGLFWTKSMEGSTLTLVTTAIGL